MYLSMMSCVPAPATLSARWRRSKTVTPGNIAVHHAFYILCFSGSQLHVKTVKKLNSDAVIAELDLSVVCDLNTSDLSGNDSVSGDQQYHFLWPGCENSLSKYQFSCVKCNMIFLSSSELKRHSQTVHGKEETILCQVHTHL